MVLNYFEEDNENEIYVSVYLKTLSFWERLAKAWNYIQGNKSIYGDFDELY